MKNCWLFMLSALIFAGVLTACGDDKGEREEPVFLKGAKIYDNKALVLTYGDTPMFGKQVTFSTDDGKSGTILMEGLFDPTIFAQMFTKNSPKTHLAPGVIPGELSTLLNVQLVRSGNKYAFEGTDTNNGREIKYAGEVDSTMLKLSLQVVMPSNDLLGTWIPAPIIPGEGDTYKSLPLFMSWECTTLVKLDMHWLSPVSPEGSLIVLPMDKVVKLASVLASPALAESLRSISFLKDGNIVAVYKKEGADWMNSPINLAQYYIRGQNLFIQLNINNIMALANTKSEMESRAGILDMMTQLGELLSKGIPLNVRIQNGVATLSAEKTLLLPLLKMLIDPTVTSLLLPKIPESYQPVSKEVMKQLPEILKNTTDVKASLILMKKP